MAKKPLFLIIRDVRDARRDYWVTAEELKRLLDSNKLEQVNVYSHRWDYAEKCK